MKLRHVIAVSLVAVMVALLFPPSASAEEITDISVYHVGARFTVRPHIGQRSYNGKRHVVAGTVGLTNRANRPREITCVIVITFQDRDGTARVKRQDVIRLRVGSHVTRHPDYRVQLRDTNHRYANHPVNAVGHCHNHA